jgi:hypothetical protein
LAFAAESMVVCGCEIIFGRAQRSKFVVVGSDHSSKNESNLKIKIINNTSSTGSASFKKSLIVDFLLLGGPVGGGEK